MEQLTNCKEYLEHPFYEMNADCVDKFWDKLDDNNELEWWYALKDWWMMQPYLAFFGPFMISAAWMYALAVLIWPESKPSLENGPWIKFEEQPMTSMWNMYMFWTAQTSIPAVFAWSQLFTWGESNMSDFSIMYMDSTEAFLYFLLNALEMSIAYPYAMFHTFTFGLVYVA